MSNNPLREPKANEFYGESIGFKEEMAYQDLKNKAMEIRAAQRAKKAGWHSYRETDGKGGLGPWKPFDTTPLPLLPKKRNKPYGVMEWTIDSDNPHRAHRVVPISHSETEKRQGRVVVLPGGTQSFLEDGVAPASYMTVTDELAYCDEDNVVHLGSVPVPPSETEGAKGWSKEIREIGRQAGYEPSAWYDQKLEAFISSQISKAVSEREAKLKHDHEILVNTILETKNKEPMGVSQWKEYGKKYGYWDYFIVSTLAEQRARLKKKIEGLKYDSEELEFLESNYPNKNSEWNQALNAVIALIGEKGKDAT